MDEIRSAYTKEAETYDKVRFGSKAGRHRFKAERLKILHHLKGSKILELGAGTARYGIFFAKLGFDYTGIDITPKMLEVAKEKAKKEGLHLKLLEMDAHELGFKDNTFNSVFCDRTIKFFQEPVKALKEAYRVLKPKGRMIVNAETPKMEATYWANYPPIAHMLEKMGLYAKIGHFPSKLNEPMGIARYYFKEEIADMFKATGFDVIATEHTAHLPLFLLPLIPSWLLDRLLVFEVRLKRGVLGSKILVVGEKKG